MKYLCFLVQIMIFLVNFLVLNDFDVSFVGSEHLRSGKTDPTPGIVDCNRKQS